MAEITKLEDRGANWSISYADGGFDTVPKDPNVIDTAAVAADLQGQKELAAKYRMWAQNIRTKGVPVIVPMPMGKSIAIVAALTVAGYFLFRRML